MKVGFYPYTFVRTHVMRSLLLKKDEYHKLNKMKVGEITKYLQENQYQEDISSLGTVYSGSDLIDRAIKANLDRNFAKLRRICHDEVLILVDAYLKRYDIYNLKAVLRVISTGQDRAEAEEMIYGCAVRGADYYKALLKENSVKEVLSKVPWVPKGVEGKDLVEVENLLDRHYYEYLLKLADEIPDQVNLFREFIECEIETTNLLNCIRLKREDVSPEEINKVLLPEKKRVLLNQLLYLKNVNEVLDLMLKKSKYRKVIKEGVDEFRKTGSLIGVERSLKSYLLERSTRFLYQDLLSVNVIIGFMFAKEVEVKNIRMLVKGKDLGVPAEFIEKELIV